MPVHLNHYTTQYVGSCVSYELTIIIVYMLYCAQVAFIYCMGSVYCHGCLLTIYLL